MMTITNGKPEFDPLAPLNTDADVLDRVDQLISHDARRDRALWLMFLAADGVQLPVVVPILRCAGTSRARRRRANLRRDRARAQ